jgi:hypothetical protein
MEAKTMIQAASADDRNIEIRFFKGDPERGVGSYKLSG